MQSICAVIVSFNPDDSILENVDALSPQVKEVMIVDNATSVPLSQKCLQQLKSKENVTLVENSENLGIAAALNIGIKYSLNAGYEWIATFDQDSLVPANFVNTMFASYEAYPYKEKVGMIVPVYYDPKTDQVIKSRKCQEKTVYVEISANMTSGNLVKTKVFHHVGKFQDNFFIDYVDYEFCLRLRKNGYSIIQSCQSRLHHHLGQMGYYHFLGIKVISTNHSPIRRYYNARNRIFFYRKYLIFDPVFILRDLFNFVRETIKIVLVEPEKIEKLSKVALGIWHGIIGKTGRYH